MNFPRIFICCIPLLLGCSNTTQNSGEGPIITESSKTISISKFGFWDTPAVFTSDIADLTADQRSMLSKITGHTLDSGCSIDMTSYVLEVIDNNGETLPYAINREDCCETCTETQKLIHYDEIAPLLDSIDCFEFCNNRECEEGTDTSTPIHVQPDNHCLYGLFVGYDTEELWVKLSITKSNTSYTIKILPASSECTIFTELTLFSTDSETIQSDNINCQGSCSCIRHTFKTAGDYLLKVAILPSSGAGDILLGVTTD